jgi:Predicted transcriptional regulators
MDKRQVGSLAFSIDFSQPLHEQILAQMRSFIARGVIAPSDKIPSVREMAQELKINPNTVMHAYQELERDGLTEKRRGQGTFVTHSAVQVNQFKNRLAMGYTQDFLEKMRHLGFDQDEIHSFLTRQNQKKGNQ